ncbi:MAG TPA: ABC transporter permease [Vicinamibacterales bacterium]
MRGLFEGGQADREFDQEVEAHIGLLAERFVREGMTPDEGRHAAVRQFGNVTFLKETRAELRSFAPLQALGQDLRYGARLLRRSPGWTVVAVMTLAIGIAANATIFSLVQAVLLEPLPYPDSDRLVVPCTVFKRLGTDRGSVAYADIMDWRAERGLLDIVAAYNPSRADITEGAEPERVPALRADDVYFRVMGMTPLLGRFFTPEENLPNGPRVMILSHKLWTRRFGADPGVIGRLVEIFGVPTTVVGVARPDGIWPADAELVRPLGTGGQPDADMLRRDNHVYRALARLKPGVTIEQAQAKLTVVAAVIAKRETNRAETSWKLHSMDSYIVGPSARRTLWVLLGAALLVLLIACVNVANLLLARGIAREREIAVRAALGAGRRRIAVQFLAESALLSATGGVAGVVLAYWGLRALILAAPRDIPGIEQAHVDARVLVFSVGLCLATTVLAGLAPALRAARISPARSFHEAGRTVSGTLRGGRLRSVLVVCELALAIVLLTGAALLVRSVGRITTIDPGVSPEDVLTVEITLPTARYANDPQIADAFDRITAAVRRVPGVVTASAASSLPIGGGGFYLGRVFLEEGQPAPPASTDTEAAWSVVQPGYFGAMKIPILEGRAFTSHDAATSAPVIIVSQAMARKMFPNRSPIGQRIRSWRDENLYREIVGVAGDVRYYSLAGDVPHNVYVPHTQNSWNGLSLVIRTRVDPLSALASVRSAVWSVDKKLALANVQTMQQIMDKDMAEPRLSMFLLVLFGLTALALSAIGVYGIVAYAVTERTREIGIRMALGAARLQVVAMLVWRALRLAAAGLLFGLAAALALTRTIESLLFEVKATDPAAFGAAAMLLVGIAVTAACIPAYRASRVDPVATLRSE